MSTVSTSIPTQAQPKPFAFVPKEMIWCLRVDQYHQMIRNGILTADDRVELLEGMLVNKMAKRPPHRIATRRTMKAIERVIPAGWYVDTQEPVTLEESEPEPDVMVARGETEDYRDRHPGPEDCALIVEVSDSTLDRDSEMKKRIYAHDGIGCYWIVNLLKNRIEVYTAPFGKHEDADYKQRVDYEMTDEVPLVIAGVEIARIKVTDLLP